MKYSNKIHFLNSRLTKIYWNVRLKWITSLFVWILFYLVFAHACVCILGVHVLVYMHACMNQSMWQAGMQNQVCLHALVHVTCVCTYMYALYLRKCVYMHIVCMFVWVYGHTNNVCVCVCMNHIMCPSMHICLCVCTHAPCMCTLCAHTVYIHMQTRIIHVRMHGACLCVRVCVCACEHVQVVHAVCCVSLTQPPYLTLWWSSLESSSSSCPTRPPLWFHNGRGFHRLCSVPTPQSWRRLCPWLEFLKWQGTRQTAD